MVTEVDQFNRGSQYQPGAYPSAVGENCFPNNTPEMIDISALQQREWEMRVYNQMHGNSTPTEAEYLFAARKVQVKKFRYFCILSYVLEFHYLVTKKLRSNKPFM